MVKTRERLESRINYKTSFLTLLFFLYLKEDIAISKSGTQDTYVSRRMKGDVNAIIALLYLLIPSSVGNILTLGIAGQEFSGGREWKQRGFIAFSLSMHVIYISIASFDAKYSKSTSSQKPIIKCDETRLLYLY